MPDILAMLTAERDKLDHATEALGGSVGSAIIRATARRKMSAAARARIASGQRARWAKARIQTEEKSAKKFVMSAAASAKISKAMKARWAAKKA
jgi:hypothetical protein